MKPDKWNKVSKEATHFTQSLLQTNPDRRLTAQQALEHPFIKNRHARGGGPQEVDQPVVDALRQFGQASKFRRCAVQMMAWSLSNEERALVRQHFVSLDQNNQGTITLSELRKHFRFSKPLTPTITRKSIILTSLLQWSARK